MNTKSYFSLLLCLSLFGFTGNGQAYPEGELVKMLCSDYGNMAIVPGVVSSFLNVLLFQSLPKAPMKEAGRRLLPFRLSQCCQGIVDFSNYSRLIDSDVLSGTRLFRGMPAAVQGKFPINFGGQSVIGPMTGGSFNIEGIRLQSFPFLSFLKARSIWNTGLLNSCELRGLDV
ncbi:MAG: hypothetical protein LBL71_02805, partial [Endomicrobium sp.]|nr:hypothetical protein [Endomicrobium sp.]